MDDGRSRNRRSSSAGTGKTDARSSDGRNYTDRNGRASERTYGTRAGLNQGKRRRRRRTDWGAVMIALLIVAVVLGLGVFLAFKWLKSVDTKETEPETEAVTEQITVSEEPETEALENQVQSVLARARLMAAQYDYDGAQELISADPSLMELEEVKSFLTEIESVKATLVEQDVTKITHVFFHILMADPSNCLDKNKWGKQAEGYNSLMTTIPEFKRILEEMYQNGYVLVSLHDMGTMETQADGTEKMVKGKIMLPEGKKAFVMSEDDVCYYEYMKGAGFADRMIIGEDGKPTLHYTDSEGNESVGDYDIVPILDKFIEEHPDFSYHGHKACLVFTGYNGILGYRTDETYLPENYEAHKVEGGHDVEAERKEAVRVLKALADDGYDLGSHSWGHRDMGEMSYDALVTDMEKWDKNVNSLIREATGKDADILIYPKGADIGDWRGYTSSDQKKEGCLSKFNYLYGKGFRYFCNVDSSQYWIQYGDTYIRTGRRALDGYNFYIDITENKGRFKDLWADTRNIFDSVRPTPVPAY